ncbi:uncharacterized protein LOC112900561 [Panicum hallii]|uniref:uncharacterized protein LOC112900561 n=1 Tax=Panicum hallii TaxID=206008 RepID=UPI000DF4E5DD|nr:uncharacterized protein LOC112900561 [Panicum hallii]
MLDPVVTGSQLTQVLIDGGSGLNLLFVGTLKKMGMNISNMLTLFVVTFRTKDIYRAEYVKFEVANLESSYLAILGRPALTKFMAAPHYVYLLLKMPGKAGAIEDDSTTRVPDALAEVFVAAQQLPSSDMAILTKKSSQSSVKPTSEVGMKAIQLQEGDPSKIPLIGTGLSDK